MPFSWHWIALLKKLISSSWSPWCLLFISSSLSKVSWIPKSLWDSNVLSVLRAESSMSGESSRSDNILVFVTVGFAGVDTFSSFNLGWVDGVGLFVCTPRALNDSMSADIRFLWRDSTCTCWIGRFDSWKLFACWGIIFDPINLLFAVILFIFSWSFLDPFPCTRFLAVVIQFMMLMTICSMTMGIFYITNNYSS